MYRIYDYACTEWIPCSIDGGYTFATLRLARQELKDYIEQFKEIGHDISPDNFEILKVIK